MYLRDGLTLFGSAQLLDVQVVPSKEGRVTAVLDKTWFYPAGGGQPADVGCIECLDGSWRLDVDAVRVDPMTELVMHEGVWRGVGETAPRMPPSLPTVSFRVDDQIRSLHNRLHTAGHVLDLVIFDVMGFNDLSVGKAYHYPQGPAVEYHGKIPGISGDAKAKQNLIERMQAECNALIARNLAVAITFEDGDPMDDKLTRYMSVESFPRRIPCGGTHCTCLGLLGKMIIRKIEMKGNVTRVAYGVS